jgi:hypothetical protein
MVTDFFAPEPNMPTLTDPPNYITLHLLILANAGETFFLTRPHISKFQRCLT